MQNKYCKLLIVLGFTIFTITIFGYFVFAKNNQKSAFLQAKDFPREALIYVETRDLPAIIKLWDESKLKENYLASTNFDEFQNRHLALKLVSRWEEFNTALGFPIELATVANSSENRAAVAVYDIGKMEIVFIAPRNDELFSATMFAQMKGIFDETTMENGTVFYSKAVEADRGRQAQKIIFASVDGRFVLATSEKLFLQTITNIKNKSDNNRLSDELSFKILSDKITPHLATVWLNQARLNSDYYFKHYWLMNNLDEIKKFRAEIFDFEMNEDEFIEHRKFLLNEKQTIHGSKIPTAKAEKLIGILPASVPFFKLQTAKDDRLLTSNAVFQTLFDSETDKKTESKKVENYWFYGNSNYESEPNYSYLDGDFGEEIDDVATDEKQISNSRNQQDFLNKLSEILAQAKPEIILSATSPKKLPAPLFAEFRRVTGVECASVDKLNRENLEEIIVETVEKRLTVANTNANLRWETHYENNLSWRELKAPLLGWSLNYAIVRNQLIFANNSDFLSESFANKESQIEKRMNTAFDDLTVIRLEKKSEAFDQIMNQIPVEKDKIDFFTDNVGGLLDVISDVRRIEIRRNLSEDILQEEIEFYLK